MPRAIPPGPISLDGLYIVYNPPVGDLVFSPERPILLFRDKLWHLDNFTGVVRSIDLANTYTAGSGRMPPHVVLQNAWQVGDYVADAGGRIFYVAGCSATANRTFTLEYCGTAAARAFIYVVNLAITASGGVNYKAGACVFTWAQSANNASTWAWNLTWELHRAKILKNNTTFTYVSPWTKGVVDARMSMKLLSPGTAVVANSFTTTDIVRI